jgi:hypothetical protein
MCKESGSYVVGLIYQLFTGRNEENTKRLSQESKSP